MPVKQRALLLDSSDVISVGGCILIVYVSISDRDDGEGMKGGVHVVGFTSASWIYSLYSHTLSLTEVTLSKCSPLGGL